MLVMLANPTTVVSITKLVENDAIELSFCYKFNTIKNEIYSYRHGRGSAV
jgi:hypothetical protein